MRILRFFYRFTNFLHRLKGSAHNQPAAQQNIPMTIRRKAFSRYPAAAHYRMPFADTKKGLTI